jgi:hypothetical protein
MKRDKRFWLRTVFASIVIHAIFCVQAYSATSEGGMVSNAAFMFLFFPHIMLMYFLPPTYPIDLTGGIVSVDWLRFVGKLFVAYPGSLFYGWILTMLRYSLFRKKAPPNHAAL